MNGEKGMEDGEMGMEDGETEETVVKRVSNRERGGRGRGQIEKERENREGMSTSF